MLVAVRERTQEIGIRRAIGAKRRDIVAQFLTEATVLSLLGGLLGVAAALGLAYALPHLADQRTIVSYPAGALALGISAVVGIIAGLGPANQAASLDPPRPSATSERRAKVGRAHHGGRAAGPVPGPGRVPGAGRGAGPRPESRAAGGYTVMTRTPSFGALTSRRSAVSSGTSKARAVIT